MNINTILCQKIFAAFCVYHVNILYNILQNINQYKTIIKSTISLYNKANAKESVSLVALISTAFYC